MTDNTNDAEKTPKPRTPRKPRKAADAATPPAPQAATAEGAEGAQKVRKGRRAEAAGGSPKTGRARKSASPEPAGSPGPVVPPEPAGPAEGIVKVGRAEPGGETGRAERVEVERVEVVATPSEESSGPSEELPRTGESQRAGESSGAGLTPGSEQAARDARAEWFERAERARSEERSWTPWARPAGRDEQATGREEHAGSGERARAERARDEQRRAGRVRDERAQGGKDPLGAVTEEAFKLFETLQQKATRELRKNLIKGTMTGLGDAFSGSRGRDRDVWEEAVSDHEEYICRACPVCRAMAAQRESGGAVTDHLMQAGTELFAAFKSAVDGLGKPAPGQRARDREPDDTPVEHIDLG